MESTASELTPQAIGRVLGGVGDLQHAAERLVLLAGRRAVRDGLTAVVVDHGGQGP